MEIRTIYYAYPRENPEVQCSCGYREEFEFERHFYDYFKGILKTSPVCPECNTHILVSQHDDVYYHVLEKNRTLSDVEIYKIISKSSGKLEKLTRIRFDLLSSSLMIEKNNEMIELKNKTQAKRVFSEILPNRLRYVGHGGNQIGDALGSEMTQAFINQMFDTLTTSGEKLFSYVTSLPLQVLLNAGYGKWRNVLYLNDIIKSKETKPHAILKIPKIILSEFKDIPMSRPYLQMIQSICAKYDGQDVFAGFQIARNENYDLRDELFKSFLKLAESESLPSFQKFARYIFIEAKHRQGIINAFEATKLLFDAISMAKEMNLDYEMMPKSIKVMHDVFMMNYEVVRSAKENEKFKSVLEDEHYRKLVFDSKDFKIVSPNSGDDLVREGRMLSHCVGSYFNRVMNKQSKIYFLRKSSDAERPLVTIEVCGSVIHQASGKSNRPLLDEERAFVSKWAKEKNLKFY
jgi:hypothetical protein